MSNPTDIDRLIEDGLTSYGEGDLEGALRAWERALKLDADNAQAHSYVDYVRQNYDLLTGETADVHGGGPFGIADDESDYQIEIVAGESAVVVAPPMYMDPLDAGWFIEDEGEPRKPRKEPIQLSLDPPELAAAADPSELTLEPAPINFDALTREYPDGPAEAKRLDHAARFPAADPITAEFHPEPTPGFGTSADFQTPLGPGHHTPGFESSGFAVQVTDVRKRDNGFVKAIQAAAVTPPRGNPSSVPPELKMTLRTPGDPITPVPNDLVASLPSPTKPATTGSPPTRPSERAASGLAATRDLPIAVRAPAPPEPPPSSSTRDFPLEKTQKRSNIRFDRPDDTAPTFSRELITAPTRDLGLRPLTERSDATPVPGRKPRQDDGTRTDVILPFDPIDARSAQILDDIDVGAPERESKEDRTRRRISALFERAVEWSQVSELDRAVTAIDLALSEDPNSALAQKLIHRNRDTMMTVFQAFLGDLQRQPALARPLHELANAPISPRAAFLLSRVDGSLSLDEILDVSGMPRLEAYRYLCQLFLRGILR